MALNRLLFNLLNRIYQTNRTGQRYFETRRNQIETRANSHRRAWKNCAGSTCSGDCSWAGLHTCGSRQPQRQNGWRSLLHESRTYDRRRTRDRGSCALHAALGALRSGKDCFEGGQARVDGEAAWRHRIGDLWAGAACGGTWSDIVRHMAFAVWRGGRESSVAPGARVNSADRNQLEGRCSSTHTRQRWCRSVCCRRRYGM